MRKLILMLLLAVVSSSAMAEWVKIDENETTTIYVDPATIHQNGNKVKIWHLFDFKAAQLIAGVKPYMSSTGQDEYDCREELWRQLALTSFSGNMGEGETVYSDYEVNNWRPVSLTSTSKTLWKYVCRMR